jgi:DNA polymerase
MKCDLEGANISIIRHRRAVFGDIMGCYDCELGHECKAPVLPSKGLYNVAIFGEAPGRDEDKEGIGFFGASGNLLWRKFARHGLERESFHVSNIVKCYPSVTKTPAKKHILTCSKWIDEELDSLKPVLALVFGNTGLKFFKDKDSGIMELNGTTEWNEKYGMWICWCMHPAAALYHRENEKLFDDGINNFTSKIRILGGIIKDSSLLNSGVRRRILS